MAKKRINEEGFDLPLIISVFLILDVIILFFICLIELSGVSHIIMLTVSFIIEFIFTLFVINKSNIKSSLILYILLLASPVFLNLIAMIMHFITKAMPFTPTVLLLFRSGYDLKGNLMNPMMRLIISFRLPALMAIVISLIGHFIRVKKPAKLEKV